MKDDPLPCVSLKDEGLDKGDKIPENSLVSSRREENGKGRKGRERGMKEGRQWGKSRVRERRKRVKDEW